MKNESNAGLSQTLETAKERISADGLDMIGHIQVALEAQVGSITMSVEQFFKISPGDVLAMNELLEAPLTLLMNGKPVARGELLAVDDHFGIRILEVG